MPTRSALAVPPVDEQRSIAAFLDHETAKIDTLVAKKRLLLERLAEYRTALITRTVTKGLPPEAARAAGLNPNPPLKPSGVEWLARSPSIGNFRNLVVSVHSSREAGEQRKMKSRGTALHTLWRPLHPA